MKSKILSFLLIAILLVSCEMKKNNAVKNTDKSKSNLTDVAELPKQKYNIVTNRQLKYGYTFFDKESRKKITAKFGLFNKPNTDGKKLFLLLYEDKNNTQELIQIFYYFWDEGVEKLALKYDDKNKWLTWGDHNSEGRVIIKWEKGRFVQYPIKSQN